MKFPQFQYVKPRSLDEALALLAAANGTATPIAGGQSLLAGLSMRIATPASLVDLGALAELKGITFADDAQSLRIGAMTRHADMLASPLVRQHVPLLHEAVQLVGHVAIRNRGTLGGSLAYADPAAELPACAVALGATLTLVGLGGQRSVEAADFFRGFLETALEPGELIVDVRFPVAAAGQLSAILEFSRRTGDFAQAGLAVVARATQGMLDTPRFVYFGCVDRARLATRVNGVLAGAGFPVKKPAGLAAAVDADIEPSDSPGCRADTKAKWAQVLTGRVIDVLNQRAVA